MRRHPITLKRAIIAARIRAYVVLATSAGIIVFLAVKYASNPATPTWAWGVLVFATVFLAACSVPYVAIYWQLLKMRRNGVPNDRISN